MNIDRVGLTTPVMVYMLSMAYQSEMSLSVPLPPTPTTL